MMATLIVATFCAVAAPPSPAQAVQDAAEAKPLVPGDSGYVIKRARELVDLARCRDAAGRTDLLLGQSRERLREREAMGNGLLAADAGSVAKSLGESYRHLALEGGAGTIECGVAEGHDMKEAQRRYLEGLRADRDRWDRLLVSLPAEDRIREEHVLQVAEEAPQRSRDAEAAGLAFLKRERVRRDSPPEQDKARQDPDPVRKETENPRKEEEKESPHPPEHHPPHPHRPHH